MPHCQMRELILTEIAYLENRLQELRIVLRYHEERVKPGERRNKRRRQWDDLLCILQEHGPLTTAEIAGRLIEKGYPQTRKNLQVTIYTCMYRRAHLFRRTLDNKWEAIIKKETPPPPDNSLGKKDSE